MPYLLGNNKIVNRENRRVEGELNYIDDEEYYLIRNVDMMAPFFTTIVSDSDHWLYLSSNGGITGGRRNPESSIFPYYTDDKIIDFAPVTGHKAILKIQKGQDRYLWEPFSDTHLLIYNIERNIYKSVSGNSILFEERNIDLGISYKYFWYTSEKFGLIKKCILSNNSSELMNVEVLDGLINVLPFGVDQSMQINYSTLVDAYKKTELERSSGIGIFRLASIPSDQTKPAESLISNTIWSVGLPDPGYLLSTKQLDAFISGKDLIYETESKGVKGSYLVNSKLELHPSDNKSWYFALEVEQEIPDIKKLIHFISSQSEIGEVLMADIKAGVDTLKMLVGKSDGIQKTFDRLSSWRHFSNTLFNIMRGGTFPDDYYIEKDDFRKHLKSYSKQSDKRFEDLLSSLPERFTYHSLIEITGKIGNNDLIWLSREYLPLIFSRRHGDPSRPWNKFDIQLKNADGSLSKYYEGNWRDIFQNWEALSYSYPGFLPGMISRFLNASTIDGYNPYRITRDGIDWEVQDPNDNWSFIGYWGDHQIIYLLRLLELSEKFFPGDLKEIMDKKIFSFANVPYRIVPYEKIISNPKETIDFDLTINENINSLVQEIGNKGKLILDKSGNVLMVSFTEKILITTMSRLYNLIPDAGIWMNTQRPEWNDANNALVGNGVSMVTLYYLRRMLKFLSEIFNESKTIQFTISTEVYELFEDLRVILLQNIKLSSSPGMTDVQRKKFVDDMGTSGSLYREKVYSGLSGEQSVVSKDDLISFIDLSLNYCDHTIGHNKRDDGLYNSYMLLEINPDEFKISPLSEMLEGQVAVLSSGILSLAEVEELIDGLYQSRLFRPDQNSFILYPDRKIPEFISKNIIPEDNIRNSRLLTRLVEEEDVSILNRDLEGQYHFNSRFINSDILSKAIIDLPSGYNKLVKLEKDEVMAVYESVFNHKSFTGRSGSFYKYEGLGSIYWHMVSKLLLAIGENIFNASEERLSESFRRLTMLYYKVRSGIGVHKSPEDYGAFPLDPYSHTPSMSGVQQPGLTGQVKEDIISRLMELGVYVEGGHIKFKPLLLRKSELPPPGDENGIFEYSFCNIPVNYSMGEKNEIAVLSTDNENLYFPGLVLDRNISDQIFARTGSIKRLKITLKKYDLLDFS